MAGGHWEGAPWIALRCHDLVLPKYLVCVGGGREKIRTFALFICRLSETCKVQYSKGVGFAFHWEMKLVFIFSRWVFHARGFVRIM